MPATLRITIALAAVLVCGCGSYTKQDYIARADAVCAATTRQTRLLAPPSFTSGARQQLRALSGYAAEVLPLVQSEASALRALPMPKQAAADRATALSFLAAFSAVVDDYRNLHTAAAAGDATGVARAEAALSASAVASLAARYGLHSCGTAGATTAS